MPPVSRMPYASLQAFIHMMRLANKSSYSVEFELHFERHSSGCMGNAAGSVGGYLHVHHTGTMGRVTLV